MSDFCPKNCQACGKCAGLPVLEHYHQKFRPTSARTGTGVAADLGTTNVVLALLDLSTGRVAARHSFPNPQNVFGPDVLSRAAAADNGHTDELRRLIREAVTNGIAMLTTEKDVGICVAGNTVMTRFFTPRPGERVVPCLSEFVGGDVLAGLVYVLPEGKESFLLIDLGTNAEMAFFNRGKLTVTSAAAGPAFERGGRGASSVIGECASLLRQGLIGASGTPETRDLQLAKSAVRTGIEILTGGGLPDAVYLAGGIGQAMAVEDAVAIGLLPPELAGKACAAGNAALGGVARLLLDPDAAASDMERLRASAVPLDLAGHTDFEELFLRHMAF
jgi:uncharacterized 2Fe-2S/4Fe-4S cluster protein (DUF4445 family)